MPDILVFLEHFSQLGLSAPLLKAIGSLGFETPTDIQRQAIPLLLEGTRDFIGLAQTGTGKTAAFGLPLLELLDPDNDAVQALILAPTRELGQQIAGQLELFAGSMPGISTVAVYGGAPIINQIRQLQRPRHVVIATPGRLIDLVKRKALSLEQIKYVVLDEADEMLTMGFKEELDEILSFTPAEKQTWLFSATMPREIRRLIGRYMTDPAEVRIDPGESVNTRIEHRYAVVRHTDKTEALTRFLDLDPDLYGLVFCRTKRETQELAEELLKRGYRADSLHGDLSQHLRDRVMRRFKERDLQVLIATDVAARGIDVDDLTHVFHHSLPNDRAAYTHRAGRTARAGKEGMSVAFINSKEKAKINRLSGDLGIGFEAIDVPRLEDIAESRARTWALGLLNGEAFGKISDELVSMALNLMEELPKEELVARLLSRELASVSGKQEIGKQGRERERGREQERGASFARKQDRGARQDRGTSFARKEDRGEKSWGGSKSRVSEGFESKKPRAYKKNSTPWKSEEGKSWKSGGADSKPKRTESAAPAWEKKEFATFGGFEGFDAEFGRPKKKKSTGSGGFTKGYSKKSSVKKGSFGGPAGKPKKRR